MCNGQFCSEHRLPEDHMCEGIYHWSKAKPPKQKPTPVPTMMCPPVPKQKPKTDVPKAASKSPPINEEKTIPDIPRTSLCRIIRKTGPKILDDPARLRACLRDLCKGQNSSEINAIINTLEEKIPQEILRTKDNLSHSVLFAQLKKKILENTYLSEPLACWAIQTWFAALGVSDKK